MAKLFITGRISVLYYYYRLNAICVCPCQTHTVNVSISPYCLYAHTVLTSFLLRQHSHEKRYQLGSPTFHIVMEH